MRFHPKWPLAPPGVHRAAVPGSGVTRKFRFLLFQGQGRSRGNRAVHVCSFGSGGGSDGCLGSGCYALKKPYGVLYKKKNITRPFEDQTSLEFFSKKSDCSLFMFGSHNKKRPNNLVIGRMYDYHVLDMIELGIEKFVSLKDIKNSKCPEGTKPMLIFAGDDFDVTEDYRRLKSLLIDFFRGPTVTNIRLAGLEYVLHFTALNGKIYFRSYKLLLKKSGCRTPRIELEEMGPSLDLVLRRTHLASDDLYKLSMKMPKALKPKKKKNISHDTFGTTYGRIHMQKQDLSKLQTRKVKGLKKRPAERITEDQEKKSKRIKKN
ncbi:PREDICTED: ribosome production factor 2 homolog isoform X1 [Hipposideros armiger]|uniref:Ribosome production factor 2 homolog n=1 Tax=Hipposideros armiger TaxID=186990 RepID=A0A8B7RLF2_HIPAR|nr:PREDICTED: ribosome production factor 2 homolog isoform X1 [Hipposideros armiger]